MNYFFISKDIIPWKNYPRRQVGRKERKGKPRGIWEQDSVSWDHPGGNVS